MIEVRLPQLFPTHTVRETITIEHWYVAEGDILQPQARLLKVEGPPGFWEIPAPPSVTKPARVKAILAPTGTGVHLGDLLITIEILDGQEPFEEAL